MRPPTVSMCAILAILIAPFHTGSAADKTRADFDAGAAIAAAIEDPRRLPGDRARDADRKPEAILTFAGLRPGMTVLDMFSGGGYYTQLAASVVGPQGKVVAHNNTPYATIAREQIEQRYADGRLPWVEQILGENNRLSLEAGAFDVALLILCYHDVYYIDGQRGWERIDRPLMLAELYSAVKPGGVVLVVDHVADPDTPDNVVAGLHRIDPALIKADFTAAGFHFDAESDVLSNDNDPHDVIAMAPHVRGKTDRAVLRFRKPAHDDDGVLIFGATRNTGLEIAKILVGRGEAVTAFVRPTSNLENLEPLDVDYFIGDALNSDDVHRAIVSGKFKAIFSTLGSGRGETPVDVVGTVNILDAARTEGIDRLIVVTIVGPGESILMVPEHLRESHAWAIDIKDEAEKHIMASDLDYTIIRPAQLTSNPRSGIIKLSLEPEPTGPVTRGDLADMAVWTYDNDESVRKVYHAVGDDPLAEERMDDPGH